MAHRPFAPREAFAPSNDYQLLPFRFDRLEDGNYLATNDVGEHLRLDPESLDALVHHRLDPRSEAYRSLKSRHFLRETNDAAALDLLALKYRSRTEPLAEFTGLHIFVVTLRCDHSCQYCQVSRRSEDAGNFDLQIDHADRAIDMVFRSPNPRLKIEFQGGEPLLNLPLIAHIVESVTARGAADGRDIQFVIASNLTRLNDDALELCARYGIHLSTSIDGPSDLHDRQRTRRGGGSHASTVAAIERARAALGPSRVSALMTTTPASLDRVESIVDEYVRLRFSSIFLRSLSPYGFATRSLVRRYDAQSWLRFFARGLARVIEHNSQGYPLREEYTAVLLQKMFSPMGSSYVDLQSPAGIGVGAIVYNYDGAVYASDEGRMLAEMKDDTFRLGHLDTHTYEEMLTSPALLGLLAESLLESAPMCSDCAYLPWCGADPAYHRATQSDSLGHKAFSDFCTKQMGALKHLLHVLDSDKRARDILMGWV